MDNIKTNDNKLLVPLVVSLLGVLILIVSIFLPYMTAVGELAEYIETFPDAVVNGEQNLTNENFENVSLISISTITESIWGKDDTQITDIFLIVFGSFAILTTVFIFFKKPIIAIICDLLACGTLIFFSIMAKDVYINDDKYAWGVGPIAMFIAIIIIFIGMVWMLISKIIQKKKQNSPL